MNPTILPSARKVESAESLLTEEQIARELLERIGQVTDEYPDGKTELVAVLEVQSMAIGKGKRPLAIVSQVLETLKKESEALKNLSPVDFDKASDFEAAVKERAELITPAQWIDSMKRAHGVTTYAALRKETIRLVEEAKLASQMQDFEP